MSYKRKPKNIVIKVEGDYEGLEIVMKSLTVKDFREILPVLTKAEHVDETNLSAIQDLVDSMTDILVKRILSWNMEDDDGPVPTSEIANEEIALIMAVFQGWTAGMTGVDKELGKDLTSGETSPMPSLQMEML